MSSPIAPPGPGYTWNQTLNSGRGGWSAPTPAPAPTTTTPLSPLNTSNVQGTILPTDANYQSPTPLSPLNNMGTGSQPFNGTMYDTRNVQGTILPTDANYNELMTTGMPSVTTPPMPFNGTMYDTRNVQGTILPTDANYNELMATGMPSVTTPPMLYGQGPELPTNTGGTAVQMFGGMPQDTTPPMPMPTTTFTPYPKLYGQGPELPTNTGGTVVQMFGGRPPEMGRPPVPLPYERGVMPLAQPRAANSLAARKLQRLQRQALRQNAPSPLSSLTPAPVKRLATAPQSGYRPIQNLTLPRPKIGFAEGGSTTPAWQRAEGKSPSGGLNAVGRASYKRETGGELKAPQPEGGSRKKSFCARMGGMKKKLTSSKTANDPDSRINKALRKWKC